MKTVDVSTWPPTCVPPPTDAAKKVVPDIHEQWQLIANARGMNLRMDAMVNNEQRLIELCKPAKPDPSEHRARTASTIRRRCRATRTVWADPHCRRSRHERGETPCQPHRHEPPGDSTAGMPSYRPLRACLDTADGVYRNTTDHHPPPWQPARRNPQAGRHTNTTPTGDAANTSPFHDTPTDQHHPRKNTMTNGHHAQHALPADAGGTRAHRIHVYEARDQLIKPCKHSKQAA